MIDVYYLFLWCCYVLYEWMDYYYKSLAGASFLCTQLFLCTLLSSLLALQGSTISWSSLLLLFDKGGAVEVDSTQTALESAIVIKRNRKRMRKKENENDIRYRRWLEGTLVDDSTWCFLVEVPGIIYNLSYLALFLSEPLSTLVLYDAVDDR